MGGRGCVIGSEGEWVGVREREIVNVRGEKERNG